MKQLVAKDFKAAGKKKKVTFEELDGFVYIKKLTPAEAFGFKDDEDSTDKTRSYSLIMESVIDKKGNKVFQDVQEVEDSGLGEFTKLTEAISEYNGLSKKQTEQTEKN